MRTWILMAALAGLGVGVAGCAQEESTLRQRQDAALKDPWNYSPYETPADVSGGGLLEFKPDAFRRDVNSVLSP